MDKKRAIFIGIGAFVCIIGVASAIKLGLESSTHQAANNILNDDIIIQTNKEEINQLNTKLLIFEGNLPGKDVMSFILTVNAYNATNTFPYGLEIESTHTELTNGNYSIGKINVEQTYQISFKYSEDGYITKIIIN